MYADYAVLIPQLLEACRSRCSPPAPSTPWSTRWDRPVPEATPTPSSLAARRWDDIIWGYRTIARKGRGRFLLNDFLQLNAGLALVPWLRRRPRHQPSPGRQVSCRPAESNYAVLYRYRCS